MTETTQWYTLRYHEGFISGFAATDDIAAANESLHLMRKFESKIGELFRISGGRTLIATIRAHKTEPLHWVQKAEEFESE